MGPSEPETIEMSADIEAEGTDDRNFACGVVEGFYGRPWSEEQRYTLFKRMKSQGLNTYVYAPKDDYKHRAYWREMYNAEEIRRISSLIKAARENDIVFYYAISPGLDISFSNEADVEALKNKLQQVKDCGCDAFSLLFDDIDPQLSMADLQKYASSAHAQAAITNVMYEHLLRPNFLFCPTEYCATRALPTVKSSPYLNTIGQELHPSVQVMWTGYQVISAVITVESIKEVAQVLRRRPVIWDNIHANDYDQKRVFLGPFDGRAPELRPYLSGVLTNPNCEFECNWVAIHTLAQWNKCVVSSPAVASVSAVAMEEPMKEDTDHKLDVSPRSPSSPSALPSSDGPAVSPISPPSFPSSTSPSPSAAPLSSHLGGSLPPLTAPTSPLPSLPLPPLPRPASPSSPLVNGVEVDAALPVRNPFLHSPERSSVGEGVFCPLEALKLALREWVEIFNQPVAADTARPLLCKWTAPAPAAPTPAPAPAPTAAAAAPAPMMAAAPFPSTPITHVTDLQEIKSDSSFQPVSNPVNALGGSLTPPPTVHPSPKTGGDSSDTRDGLTDCAISGEPMDCAPSPSTSSPGDNDSGVVGVSNSFLSEHDQLCDRDIPAAPLSSEGDVDVEFREALSASSSTATGLASSASTDDDDVDDDETTLHSAEDSAPPADPMQVDEAISPNPEVSISDSISEHTSTTTTSNSDSTLTLDAAAPGVATEPSEPVTEDDLFLLADLFYTPFAHGSRGLHMLFEFEWLKCNAYLIEEVKKNPEKAKEAEEWHARAASFLACCSCVSGLFRRVLKAAHRPLVFELYAYIWDMKYTIDMLESFIKWTALGHLSFLSCRLLQGRLSWCTQGYREAFTSGEHEPWVFRGGLVAEFQRMLPIEAARDLFVYGIPDLSIALQTFMVRPYLPPDESSVYEICRKTCDDGSDGSHGFPNHPDLIGDKLVGAFVTLSPEQCFVVEDSLGICGYVVAAPDAKKFVKMTELTWIPEMVDKYPKDNGDAPESMTDGMVTPDDSKEDSTRQCSSRVKEIIQGFHDFAPYLPESLYTAFPSVLRIGLLPRIKDFTLGRRLMATVFACLRANGHRGVHVTIPVEDKHTIEFYYSLGFMEVQDLLDKPENIIVLGRMM